MRAASNGVRDDQAGVAGDHQHDHRLTDRAAQAEHDRREDARAGRRDHDFVGRLPPRVAERQGALAQRFGHACSASSEIEMIVGSTRMPTIRPAAKAVSPLDRSKVTRDPRHDERQADKAEHDRGDRGHELDDGLRDLFEACPSRTRRGRPLQRCRPVPMRQSATKVTHSEPDLGGQEAELGIRRRRIPVRTGQHLPRARPLDRPHGVEHEEDEDRREDEDGDPARQRDEPSHDGVGRPAERRAAALGLGAGAPIAVGSAVYVLRRCLFHLVSVSALLPTGTKPSSSTISLTLGAQDPVEVGLPVTPSGSPSLYMYRPRLRA